MRPDDNTIPSSLTQAGHCAAADTHPLALFATPKLVTSWRLIPDLSQTPLFNSLIDERPCPSIIASQLPPWELYVTDSTDSINKKQISANDINQNAIKASATLITALAKISSGRGNTDCHFYGCINAPIF